MTEDKDNQDLIAAVARSGGAAKKDAGIENNNNFDHHNQEMFGDVCRDFLRNVCRRGNACRYRHPDPSEAEELGKKIEYIFCHDYQNRECRRQNCRFLHCTKQEEEIYRTSGKLPQHILDKMAANKAQEMAKTNGDPVPVCKDFLKGDCRRGAGRCKFRHISQADYEMELRAGSAGGGLRYANNRSTLGTANYSDRGYDTFAPPEPKRRAYEAGTGFGTAFAFGAERGTAVNIASISGAALGPEFDYAAGAGSLGPAATAGALPHQSLYSNTRFLEEENTALRRRIDELKKQVADLMATNEFLLEQNAQLRTLGKTVSANAPQPPGPAAAPPPPLGPPPLPPISSDLLAQQPVVPASLASLGAQGGIPVSSMAALSTSVISTSTTPLVSYPIMTAAIQSLRPPTIPHSLSH
ncbi:Zinc finger CCCH domain-containing protein 10-like protein [Dinothrombium tinctorium]|uniref:Zinc finger CCCH domain-containing protein 10-like protein n=1 Tax=Dinothrombium tinctorium TaxID=1965070 RepID=A0A3S3NPI2_9ACAR|nr:Zinc finger CCCH domain-containing protein 10-like protein [Dinothrombium tinctorium]RWS06719.1 Zinc finger CCCH domain-containing protein 10-like protein [Dinothrombium tinctorium]